MKRAWVVGLGLIAMMTLVIGCGGTPQPTAEEMAPDYGVNAMEKMKGMVGTPKAAKTESALEKMKRMSK